MLWIHRRRRGFAVEGNKRLGAKYPNWKYHRLSEYNPLRRAEHHRSETAGAGPNKTYPQGHAVHNGGDYDSGRTGAWVDGETKLVWAGF